MRTTQESRITLPAIFLLLFASVTITATAFASDKEKVLFSFDLADGSAPECSLILDSEGRLYGTTDEVGTPGCGSGCGVVFQLSRGTGKAWSETVLHNFAEGGTDGLIPVSGLVGDAFGNLYGATYGGGSYNFGTVYELTPNLDGSWAETVIHSFTGGEDGGFPEAGVIVDSVGNLYGTTVLNGGTVFELSPSGDGEWTETVIHAFVSNGDGSNPYASLVMDKARNIYGTTYLGGSYDSGAVFQLTAAENGQWEEEVLHSFNGNDGSYPTGSLTLDAAGNLYGTTSMGGTQCGTSGCGTVFMLSKNNGWVEKVLYSFGQTADDGASPEAGLIFYSKGRLYGTAAGGGLPCGIEYKYGCGTVFRLDCDGSGRCSETVLHMFENDVGDGTNPDGSLIFDSFGNLYGTTIEGGSAVSGVYT